MPEDVPHPPGRARQLNRRVLPRLDPATAPRVGPDGLRVGIVHLGLGAFHRAHQAVYTEDALAAEPGDWGICGVSQRTRTVVDRLLRQDGLYGILERGPASDSLRVVGVLRDALLAAEAPVRLASYIAAPSTHIVSITVTEKGYRLDPVSGRLREDDADVRADVGDRAGSPPRTPVGQLVRGLQARMAAGHGAPLTVLCCDNLRDNGGIVRTLVADFCARLPPGEGRPLAAWIEDNVAFPSTVVDRIVPATTPRDLADAERLLGLADDALVVAEPFRQWVIEDRFAGPRPAWDRAGALFVGDVSPYEVVKLRLLNGGHSMLAYLGELAGYGTVDGAVRDPALGDVLWRLIADDLLPTLPEVPGLELDEYARHIPVRLANPRIGHRLAQIAADGSQKLPQRLLDAAADRIAAGAEPRWIALAVAGWLHYLRGVADDGRLLRIEDPLSDELGGIAAREASAAVVDGALKLREVFPERLAASTVFRELTVEWLERLAADGVRTTIRSASAGESGE